MLISSHLFKRLVKAAFFIGIYEARVSIDSHLSLRAVNRDNTMLIDARIPVEENDEPDEICVDMSGLFEAIKALKDGDVSVNVSGEHFVLRSGRLTYKLKLLSGDWVKRVKYPELDHTAEVKLDFEEFERAIKFCGKIADSVIFRASNGGFTIFCESDYYGRSESAEIEFAGAQGEAKALYGVDYLSDITRGGKRGDSVIIRFSSDQPAEFVFESNEDIELRYILAPRIEGV